MVANARDLSKEAPRLPKNWRPRPEMPRFSVAFRSLLPLVLIAGVAVLALLRPVRYSPLLIRTLTAVGKKAD